MPIFLETRLGHPSFPECPKCPYLLTGPPNLCLTCASATFTNISTDSCPICSQQLRNGQCMNYLCSDPERSISSIRAIAYFTDELRATIHRYKYGGKKAWAIIFGRILLAWLNAHERQHAPDIIIANPTYALDPPHPLGHTEKIIEAAATEDLIGEWPFDTENPRALIKCKMTPQSANKNLTTKRLIAEELERAIQIPNISRIQKKTVLL